MKNGFIHKAFFAAFIFVILVFVIWIFVMNKAIEVNSFEVKSEKLSSEFDGFCIAQISDLHNTSFGKNNEKLIGLLKEISPDIIAVTGDVIDSRRTDTEISKEFMQEALKIAPVYYVTGNHESRVSGYASMREFFEEIGVEVLSGESVKIERNGKKINICGFDDPAFKSDYLLDDEEAVVYHSIKELDRSEDFTVLLSHRPEFFDLYAENGFDLVLSGHAHGGQFRLPFVGGLIAPGQGFFPEYDSGEFKKDSTLMIVSRGLGNSIIPLRFNNRPEITVMVLREGKR